ncbi:MAG: molybdopterin molybdenumtransferase MoeA [Verrucomicrobia bacterium]|nr:molybdopterin molybdenumtransferase MoeA [Verrucomicrobiota bacterium]
MKTVDEVFSLLDRLTTHPLNAEKVHLENSVGRILRQNITSPEDQPPFDRSSIDGYLVRAHAKPGIYRISGRHQVGEPAPPLPAVGSAVRILTGSALPLGAALVMQEDVRASENRSIEILREPSTHWIRARGSQCKAGDTLLHAPQPLSPGSIGLLAYLGISEVSVSPKVRVAHLVTGRELVTLRDTPRTGQVRDSNSPLIASLLKAFPAELIWQKRVGDERPAFLSALRDALDFHARLLLVSGASSVGDEDHTASVLEELGFRIHARQVCVKPGKPLLLAQKGEIIAFGLPGNPLSHFVCYHLFVRRVLRAWSALPPATLQTAELLGPLIIRPDTRETWWPGRMENDEGRCQVRPLPWSDSSDLTCLATANCLIRIPAGQQARAPMQVLPTISP